MGDSGAMQVVENPPESSDMAESSSSDWFKMNWKKSEKKVSDAADAINQPLFDDPLDPRWPPLEPLKQLPFDPLNRVYDMSGDKLMVIFSHSNYLATEHYSKYVNGRPEPRNDTDKDIRRLHEVFYNQLGFRIDIQQNKKYDEIHEYVTKLSKQDHSNTSIVSVVILTHGDSKDRLMAADMPYKFDAESREKGEKKSLVQLLQNGNKWLVGKPKLFIVQACRGGKVDKKRSVLQLDGTRDQIISTHADSLILRSSVQGYLSWNDKYGSWLIQELCRVVHATHLVLDFQQMATMVTSLVVTEHTSYTYNWADNNTKQTPEMKSTLTKLLRFTSTPKADAEKN